MATARRIGLALLLVSSVVMASGCVEPFHGSDVAMTFKNITPAEEVPVTMTPAATHYELWVTVNDVVVPVYAFKVTPTVVTTDPCSIDYFGPQAGMGIKEAAQKRFDDAPADSTARFAAEQQLIRMSALQERVSSVVSYQPGDPRPDPAIAGITDTAERLRACNEFREANPEYYLGNYRTVTSPLNGLFYGMVDGNDPTSGGFVGGTIFTINYKLAGARELFITVENDDNPETMGPVYLSGQVVKKARGILNVNLLGTISRMAAATAAIYFDQDEDSVNF